MKTYAHLAVRTPYPQVVKILLVFIFVTVRIVYVGRQYATCILAMNFFLKNI